MGALPNWCEPLPDAEEMRAIDRWAIAERGAGSLDLMERAGAAVAHAVERLVPDGPVVVVCGKGNNGGDGLVVARLLRDAGRPVTVLFVCPLESLSGDARANLERLSAGRPFELTADRERAQRVFGEAAAIVDAMLGTGAAGAPHGAAAEAIELLNDAQAPVLSVDVPSGVDASTGVVAAVAVRAHTTITFHSAKPGLWIRPGKAHAGTVQRIDIGIPRGAPQNARIGLIGPSVLEALPRRGASSTKFSSGRVVVAGGSLGLTGAPLMASLAAMRGGAGYVLACIPASLQATVSATGPLELMTRGLPEERGELAQGAAAEVLQAGKSGGVLALGPGLGRGDGAVAFARELASDTQLPLVLDADGLNAHAGRLGELSSRTAPTVLTPHAGELGRLLNHSSEEIEHERLRHVKAAAEMAGAVVVLKGDDTLVAEPTGVVAVSAGGTPALASAGTGDVLTGVIAALLSQGLEPFTAACAGVWLHARAGAEAARRQGGNEGVIATDVIAALPAVRGEARR
jgi:ADP-dependent NAD(P)H-hydrate dehydratase / NAD(P)H-hydrate epimerase